MSDLGNKKIFSKNLKFYMDLYNKSRIEIAKTLGVSYTTFASWENGTNYPRIDKIEMLANYFKISKADLIENKYKKLSGESDTINFHSRVGVKIPILGEVVAGVPISAIENILGYEEITPEMAATGDFFCLKIKGASMEPKLFEGDLLVVRQQTDVDSNEIAVVLVNGDEATVKQIKKATSGITLIGYNVAVYPPRFYSNQEIQDLPVTIIGKVVELRRPF
ncbi:LexA family protein [Megasphaera hutchinsoni]|uniref:Peptidase S24-like protein n=1 Tax=Megasphaera hutchinsoni TaxID=1588748 RepID=A0A134CJV9_9FIRM|nr:S24 family peptidase [Megasphaera hutchinsoni]KXB92417.1 peptidase S24-like protein [Megasphaera hutchinsoni]